MKKLKMLEGIDVLGGLAINFALTIILLPLAGFADGLLASAAGTKCGQ